MSRCHLSRVSLANPEFFTCHRRIFHIPALWPLGKEFHGSAPSVTSLASSAASLSPSVGIWDAALSLGFEAGPPGSSKCLIADRNPTQEQWGPPVPCRILQSWEKFPSSATHVPFEPWLCPLPDILVSKWKAGIRSKIFPALSASQEL